MLFVAIACLLSISAAAFGSRAESNCTAPRAPDNSDAFMYQDGRVVKYVCDPGYVLIGRQMVRCIDGKWEEPIPVCKKMNDETADEELVKPIPPKIPERPLFNWGDDDESEKNETSIEDENELLNDEGRVRLLLYPRRSVFTTRFIRPTRLQSGTELEEEERKRSQTGDKKTIENDETKRQVISFPRAPVTQNDKGYQDNLRHMYYMAHHYYPYEYRSGSPVSATLSHSQLAWINSLHPELRDQYLRDLYYLGADETTNEARAHHAYLRRYGNAYNLLYSSVPYYYREPSVALLSEDPVTEYDYSCNQAHSSFVKAPRLPNMHIARYDRRQNPNSPHNNYLSAVYRCNPGYIMLDARHTELHCSKRRWIGVQPICVRRG
ncbi:uncharacterized protein LOC129222327 [Uloborus diversus]|uniref:uncharacterized protein LOC129222327 n=1 Tax=Uloborus diversus TaxID=327109 RepID=UPI002409C3B0|nr:uncharacterized protein LOC129222327 [Uloborus diversus]